MQEAQSSRYIYVVGDIRSDSVRQVISKLETANAAPTFLPTESAAPALASAPQQTHVIIVPAPEMPEEALCDTLYTAYKQHLPLTVIEATGSVQVWERLVPLELPELLDLHIHAVDGDWISLFEQRPAKPAAAAKMIGTKINEEAPALGTPLATVTRVVPPTKQPPFGKKENIRPHVEEDENEGGIFHSWGVFILVVSLLAAAGVMLYKHYHASAKAPVVTAPPVPAQQAEPQAAVEKPAEPQSTEESTPAPDSKPAEEKPTEEPPSTEQERQDQTNQDTPSETPEPSAEQQNNEPPHVVVDDSKAKADAEAEAARLAIEQEAQKIKNRNNATPAPTPKPKVAANNAAKKPKQPQGGHPTTPQPNKAQGGPPPTQQPKQPQGGHPTTPQPKQAQGGQQPTQQVQNQEPPANKSSKKHVCPPAGSRANGALNKLYEGYTQHCPNCTPRWIEYNKQKGR